MRGAQHIAHGIAASDDICEGQSPFTAVTDALQLALEGAGIECVAERNLQTFDADRLDDEIMGAGAHRRDHVVDAAMRRLHDDRHIDTGLTHLAQYAEAVETGHHQIENHRIDLRRVRSCEQRDGGIAAVDHPRFVTGPLHHVFHETALYSVVVSDQNRGNHGTLRTRHLSVSNRGTLADGD